MSLAIVIGELRSRWLWDNTSGHCQQPTKNQLPTASSVPPAQNDSNQIAFALCLWRLASPAVNTPVASYLQSRGINFTVLDSIRFDPHQKHPSSGTWLGRPRD